MVFLDIKGAILDPLDREEERRLIRMAIHGERKAAERLIRSNVGFAIRSATREMHIREYGLLGMEDLAQEALLGEWMAFKKWDVQRRNGFLTYAGWWIRQRLDKAYYDDNTIPVPPKCVNSPAVRRVLAYIDETGSMDPEEIGKATGARKHHIEAAFAMKLGYVRMDEHVEENSEPLPIPHESSVNPEEAAARSEALDALGKIVYRAAEKSLGLKDSYAGREKDKETVRTRFEIYCLRHGILGRDGPYTLEE
ncbi:MAG: hypothetical protein HYW25_04790, partial [Candidatus Aenigmarchaeota archaeon]|nr:hypothetical protein [Candidatus Aenigmarchaeota archaeon]